jgi:hypothetical protein
MYDELVKRLNVFRLKEDEYQIIPVYVSEIIGQAADAIEELSAFKAQITDGRFYVYKLGTLFELRHDPRELVVRYQDHASPKEE